MTSSLRWTRCCVICLNASIPADVWPFLLFTPAKIGESRRPLKPGSSGAITRAHPRPNFVGQKRQNRLWSPMNRPPNRRSYWVPNTNVFISTKGQLIIKVELSGMTSIGLEIAAEGNKLRIAGNRNDPDEEGAAQTLAAEINNGPFESELE